MVVGSTLNDVLSVAPPSAQQLQEEAKAASSAKESLSQQKVGHFHVKNIVLWMYLHLFLWNIMLDLTRWYICKMKIVQLVRSKNVSLQLMKSIFTYISIHIHIFAIKQTKQ